MADSPTTGAALRKSELRPATLNRLYLRKVLLHLAVLEKTMKHLRQAEQSGPYLKRVGAIARAIRDLAMVHGFEGMENIAGKLASTFGVLASREMPLTPPMVDKLEMAIRTMRQVVRMEAKIEQHMTVERVRRVVEINQGRLQDCAERLSDCLTHLISPPETLPQRTAAAQQPSDPLFDICEPESILTLANPQGDDSAAPSEDR